MLLGPGHCFRDQIIEACPNILNKSFNDVTATAEGSSLETLRHMVASGIGITVLPESAAISRYKEDALVIRPLSDTNATRTVALAWRASFPRHKAVDALREAILKGQKASQ
jgi:LysR family hydrogen peroxide-inducible transcriptional activator